jgi:hypothetical protein
VCPARRRCSSAWDVRSGVSPSTLGDAASQPAESSMTAAWEAASSMPFKPDTTCSAVSPLLLARFTSPPCTHTRPTARQSCNPRGTAPRRRESHTLPNRNDMTCSLHPRAAATREHANNSDDQQSSARPQRRQEPHTCM